MDRERKKEIKKRPKKTEIDVDRAYGDAPEALCSVSAFFEPQQAGRHFCHSHLYYLLYGVLPAQRPVL